uniref:Guanine nucleotide exchange factor DBS n=1 Tax=Oncorhynchus kisutch TaxID=8019 RepID=A0A8C7FLZ7_ONCKI
MQQEIRPLLAVDIIEQLHRQFALLSGGRGKDGAPIITFPEYSGFGDLVAEDFQNVVTYLTSIPSLDVASIGFVIIIDRRRDKWSSVKASLTRIAGAFPGNLQLVLVLRPSRFFQRAIADIGMKLHRDDFKMKVPIVMLNSLSDLYGYVDKGQLTCELGGNLDYCHSQWIHRRTAIENFAVTVKTTAQMLQKFGTDLAETELPNDVQCTKDLLTTHTEKHDKLKVGLCFSVNIILLNLASYNGLLVLMTENAFEQFWSKHHLKLEQCLQFRHFEHDFREVPLSDIGDCVTLVDMLLKDLKTLEEKAQESLEKAQLHALHGDQLIQSNHYSVDSIRPKCVELRRICDDFTNEAQKKYDVLSKSRQIHKGIDKVNQWCDSGVYLLASQAVDKCQSQEGAEAALQDIEKFLETAKENQLSDLKNIHNQYELAVDVLIMGFINLSALTNTTKGLLCNCCVLTDPVFFLPRHIMNELIETERLYVEELFECDFLLQGYAAELDNTELSPLIPAALENKKDVLFGNLPEIYEFHNRTFFKELENCMERPELVGTCFLKRKEELQIYEKYCQNKPRSEALWRQCGDSLFFQECQKKLDHKLSLDAYLLKPVQRITKYQLMVKEMLKCSKNQEGTAELEEALATMLDIIKSVNDSMHQIAITGFEGNLSELGKLLMQGSFNVWTDHKKGHSKVKDLARFKPMQRHLFLYNKMLLFCKKREETTDGHEKPSASYSFKHSLKMSAVGITENVKGDIKKFEVWYNGREEVYIIQAPSMDVKNMWVSEIRKVLTGQLEACRGMQCVGILCIGIFIPSSQLPHWTPGHSPDASQNGDVNVKRGGED